MALINEIDKDLREHAALAEAVAALDAERTRYLMAQSSLRASLASRLVYLYADRTAAATAKIEQVIALLRVYEVH